MPARRLPQADEFSAAMDDPSNMAEASNMAVCFVVVRAGWYLTIGLASLASVSLLTAANAQLVDDYKLQKDYINSTTPMCAFNYFNRDMEDDHEKCEAFGVGSKFYPPYGSSSDDMLQCRVVTGVTAFGTVYGIILFIFTVLLLCNKKVKVSKAVLIEFIFSLMLFVVLLSSALMVEIGYEASCKSCGDSSLISDSTADNLKKIIHESDCQEITTLLTFSMAVGDIKNSDTFSYPDFKTWGMLIGAMRDALWVAFGANFFLFVMLFIRLRNACKSGRGTQGKLIEQNDKFSVQNEEPAAVYDDTESPMQQESPPPKQPPQKQQSDPTWAFAKEDKGAGKDGNPFG